MTNNMNKGNAGTLIASIIIVAVLVAGGIYSFKVGKEKIEENKQAQAQAVYDLQAIQTQSESTEIADIEADLYATNFDYLDTELNLAEIDAAAETEIQ